MARRYTKDSMCRLGAAVVLRSACTHKPPLYGCAHMRVEHGTVCPWGVKCDGVQYSTMDGYHGSALHVGLDVQVRGGGGVAERLHASCRNAAGAEV